MNKPFFSIILPCYNAARFIGETILSVLNQTFSDFELIIIDDGSKDGSWDLIAEAQIKDPRIEAYRIENSGVSVARNTALKKARGLFVTFIDADDIMTANALTAYHASIKKNNSDLTIGSVAIHGSEHGTTNLRRDILSSRTFDEATKSEIARDFLQGEFDHANWNKVYKMELISRAKVTFEKRLITGEDMMFNWLIWDSTKSVSLIKDIVMQYRLHDNNTSRQKATRWDYFVVKSQFYQENRAALNLNSRVICDSYLNEGFWYYELPLKLKMTEDSRTTIKDLSLLRDLEFLKRHRLFGGIRVKIKQILFKLGLFDLLRWL